MKAVAPSSLVLLPERRLSQSAVLQDLGPLSSLSRIESSLPFKPGEVWLTEECASVFLPRNAKPWIPKIIHIFLKSSLNDV